MCGIMGMLKNDVDLNIIKKGIKVVNYRGPDQKGFFNDKTVGLGHCRLSIIDLSNNGKQPIHNEDETIWITYNGEIYNYLELKESLENKGHRFYTNTDTEIIIHSYEEYGFDCVKLLDGMFAFGIWDYNKKIFFLAKDRLGKKPLYYFNSKDKFIFASEIKSILQDKSVNRKINLQALYDYITYGYIPYSNTIFDSIKELAPGSILIKTEKNMIIKNYWDINFNNKKINNEEKSIKLLFQTINQSVKKRLISDVPLGVFLSGGIDSSAIVAFMKLNSINEVKTFSIGFNEEAYDETKYSRIIAENFSTQHHEKIIDSGALEILPKLVWHFDQPFFDFTAIPTYYLAQMSAKKITVALNGDGGDELFAGYPKYYQDKIISKLSPLCRLMPQLKIENSLINKYNRIVDLTKQNRFKRYIALNSVIEQNIKLNILNNKFLDCKDSSRILMNEYKQSKSNIFLEKWIYADIKRYLPCQLIPKVERTCMANSLESRSPLLDYNLVEVSTKIPASHKLHFLTTKYLFKKSLKEILPKKIIFREKKGFGVPVGKWIKEDLRFLVEELLDENNTFIKTYFNQKEIEKLFEQHKTKYRDHTSRIWSLVMLNEWYKNYYLKFI